MIDCPLLLYLKINLTISFSNVKSISTLLFNNHIVSFKSDKLYSLVAHYQTIEIWRRNRWETDGRPLPRLFIFINFVN
jgi:hypothetical protein